MQISTKLILFNNIISNSASNAQTVTCNATIQLYQMKRHKTKSFIVFFSISLCLFSCATILNRPVQKISVSIDRSIKEISIEKATLADSASLCNDSVKEYFVKRSRASLKANLQIDSSKKTFYLKPKISFPFWLNYFNYGIGMIVDLNSQKCFAYSNSYHFTARDTSNKRYRFIPERKRRKIAPFLKGAINFSLSLSPITLFNINTIDGQYKSAGIYGIESGIDYFYKYNRNLSINVGAGTDVLPVDYIGPGYIYRGSTIFTNVRDNIALKNFSLGYGISLSRFNWEAYSNSTSKIEQSVSNISFGLSLSVQYRITKYLCIGILYQPNLLNTSFKPALAYQHYATLNVGWKFPIRKTTK